MLKKILILLSICFIAFTACKKQQTTEPVENKTDVSTTAPAADTAKAEYGKSLCMVVALSDFRLQGNNACSGPWCSHARKKSIPGKKQAGWVVDRCTCCLQDGLPVT